MTSRSLGGVIVRTLATITRDVNLIPTLGAIFVINPDNTHWHDSGHVVHCVDVYPTLCMYICMYDAIVSIT